MRGFVVTRTDGGEELVEGSRYDVSDDGTLEVRLGESLTGRWPPVDWVSVESRGRILSETWPPPNLDLIIDAVAEALGRFGHYVHEVRPSAGFAAPAMNDLEAFAADALQRVGLDPELSSNRPELEAVREALQRNFGLDR